MRVKLTLHDGEKIDVRVPSDSVTIGRSKNCDVVIRQDGMSRKHCLVQLINNEFFITDLGSINGVYVEGKKITPNEPVPFKSFFSITFGCVVSSQFSADETLLGIMWKMKDGLSTPSPSGNKPIHLNGAKIEKKQGHIRRAPYSHKKKEKERSQIILNALFFLGALFAIYYFYYDDVNTEPKMDLSRPDKRQPPKKYESNDHF